MSAERFKYFEFRRLDGSVVYRFQPAGEWSGKPQWSRADGKVWCRWTETHGWIVVSDTGMAVGAPADPVEGRSERPPTGIWRSWKDDKSYDYSLIYLDCATEQPCV
jgi:hypothetical protein